MIPSVNLPEIVDQAGAGRTIQHFQCDCCANEFRNVDLATGHATTVRKIRVAGETYIACSSPCARILFQIHHQYALLEAKK